LAGRGVRSDGAERGRENERKRERARVAGGIGMRRDTESHKRVDDGRGWPQ